MTTPRTREALRLEGIRQKFEKSGRDGLQWSDIKFLLDLLAALPVPEDDERELRQMFSDGVDVARSYGDNAFHLHSEQLERQYQRARTRMLNGEGQTVQPRASLPVRPEQQDEEDFARGDSVPGVGHGDLPHKPTGVLTTPAPEQIHTCKVCGAECAC